MQQSLQHKKPQSGACDGWEWINAPFSVQGAHKRLCKGQYEENQSINKACRFFFFLKQEREASLTMPPDSTTTRSVTARIQSSRGQCHLGAKKNKIPQLYV